MPPKKTSEAQKRAMKKYREKLNRMTLEFSPAESDLWEHLQNQPNKRTYIKELIRADIAKKHPDEYTTFDKDNYFVFEVDDIQPEKKGE